MSTIPTTKKQATEQLDSALQTYYDLIQSGSSSDVVSSQYKLIENLQLIVDSFDQDTSYSSISSIALSYFNTACNNQTTENIDLAFTYYNNLQAYISKNAIGYDTSTNTPSFSDTGVVSTYDNSGNKINLISNH